MAFGKKTAVETDWINEKINLECSRNWRETVNLDISTIQNYHKAFLRELQQREEKEFALMKDLGTILVRRGHAADGQINWKLEYMDRRLNHLQLVGKCLETHMQDVVSLKKV